MLVRKTMVHSSRWYLPINKRLVHGTYAVMRHAINLSLAKPREIASWSIKLNAREERNPAAGWMRYQTNLYCAAILRKNGKPFSMTSS